MSNDVRSFIGMAISDAGRVSLNERISVSPGDVMYMLAKTNCIEIRTEAQHKEFLDKLLNLAERTKDIKYKKAHDNLLSFSRPLLVDDKGRITLGRELVQRRCFNGRVIIEECDGFIRLLHPKQYSHELNFYLGEDNKVSGKGRRRS